MKQLVHLKSTITPYARGAMRCPPLGRVFLFGAHLLACVALAPVTQACTAYPNAWATYVASYSFTANWSSVTGATSYRLDVSTSSSFDTYVPGYQNLNVGNVTHRSVTGLNASTAYYFRVRAYRGGQPCRYSTTVPVTTLSPTGPPVVITDPATYIASFSARLNGTVDPHGLTTTVYFQYGTTISYGLTTAIQSKTGNTYKNVAATIGGLTASTTYHFRIVAHNSAGTRYGADRIFTTLSPDRASGSHHQSSNLSGQFFSHIERLSRSARTDHRCLFSIRDNDKLRAHHCRSRLRPETRIKMCLPTSAA